MEVDAPSLCKKIVAIALIALVVGNQRNPSRSTGYSIQRGVVPGILPPPPNNSICLVLSNLLVASFQPFVAPVRSNFRL